MDLTKDKDTLIIVTADHSHTLMLAGYAPRGNPILGLARRFDRKTGTYVPILAQDGKPYTTLSYANGPGGVAGPRGDLTDVDTTAKDFTQQALVPLGSETHAGEDVPVYARGTDGEFADRRVRAELHLSCDGRRGQAPRPGGALGKGADGRLVDKRMARRPPLSS